MSESRLRLLVVEDDDLVRQALRLSLPSQWAMTAAPSELDIPSGHFDAAFVDLHLHGNLAHAEGVDVIAKLHTLDPHLEIVAISGDLDRELMEACLRAGATRFLAKPLSVEEVNMTLDKVEALLLLQNASLRGQHLSAHRWVGSSAVSQKVRKTIAAMKGESGPILISGESGTGKEVVAQMIHQQRAQTPLIAVNVAALPEALFESEVFGHVRGAFSGADQNKMGLSEAAHGGDLFLDEIEALPLAQQAKLLRFLESGEIRRVGSKESIHVQVRVIAATNQSLEKMVQEGRFREDLLWRLGGQKIALPPLRERTDDLSELAQFFLDQQRPRRNKSLTPEAIQAMKAYSWPGNVRELKRVCEQLSLSSPLPIIRAVDVQQVIGLQTTDPIVTRPASEGDLSEGLDALVNSYEASVIRLALERQPDIDDAARLLQISRSNLYKKIRDYGIKSLS